MKAQIINQKIISENSTMLQYITVGFGQRFKTIFNSEKPVQLCVQNLTWSYSLKYPAKSSCAYNKECIYSPLKCLQRSFFNLHCLRPCKPSSNRRLLPFVGTLRFSLCHFPRGFKTVPSGYLNFNSSTAHTFPE